MDCSFTEFSDNFFLANGEFIFFKDHGKNSTITVKIKACPALPTVQLIVGTEGASLESQKVLKTYSATYNKATKIYVWKGSITKVSRRLDNKTYRLRFVSGKKTIDTKKIRVLSKQKKKIAGKRKRTDTGHASHPNHATRQMQTVSRQMEYFTQFEALLTKIATFVQRIDVLAARVTAIESTHIQFDPFQSFEDDSF